MGSLCLSSGEYKRKEIINVRNIGDISNNFWGIYIHIRINHTRERPYYNRSNHWTGSVSYMCFMGN